MLAFSDAIFSIAMTLLVVGIAVPVISTSDDVGQLADALGDLRPDMISFAVSFTVIGRYWIAHHQFCSRLTAVDQRFLSLNLIYLGFIAFMPFPTALLGDYADNSLAVAAYALIVVVISGMEVVLIQYARNAGLMHLEMSDRAYGWGIKMALTPVLFFGLSIPLAFLSPTLAFGCWIAGLPFQLIVQRWAPDDYTEQVD